MGAVQRDFVIGPVGPLFGLRCRSPHRPGTSTHASGSFASVTRSGSTTTRARLGSTGCRCCRSRNLLNHCGPCRRPRIAGVRSRRRVDDRVRAIALELLAVPVGSLATFVLGVADADRFGGQRLLDVRCIEQHLDELPVAFVQIVPVVVVPEQPVLNGEQVGSIGLLDDVRVDGCRRLCRVHVEIVLVQAARFQRVTREFDVETLTQAVQVACGGCPLDRRVAVAQLSATRSADCPAAGRPPWEQTVHRWCRTRAAGPSA